jgi:hypothetical protein
VIEASARERSLRLAWRRVVLQIATLLGGGAILLSGCSLSGIALTADTRLRFTAPAPLALVTLPVHLAWVMSDFVVRPPGAGPVAGDAGYFAVFVDRAPMAPGQTFAAIAGASCHPTSECLTPSYLAGQGVYTTERHSLTLSQVTPLNSYQSVQLHEATVVLMDSSGRRIGESAWVIDFRLQEPGS